MQLPSKLKKKRDELAGPEPTERSEDHCHWKGKIEGFNAACKELLPMIKKLIKRDFCYNYLDGEECCGTEDEQIEMLIKEKLGEL